MRVALLEDEITVFEIFARILNLDIGGKLFVECSISLPNATIQLAQQLLDWSAELVAMPGFSHRQAPQDATKNVLMRAVFGEPGMAWKSLLICVRAGPKSCVERIRP